jgi:hypothetical protein
MWSGCIRFIHDCWNFLVWPLTWSNVGKEPTQEQWNSQYSSPPYSLYVQRLLPESIRLLFQINDIYIAGSLGCNNGYSLLPCSLWKPKDPSTPRGMPWFLGIFFWLLMSWVNTTQNVRLHCWMPLQTIFADAMLLRCPGQYRHWWCGFDRPFFAIAMPVGRIHRGSVMK